MRPKGKLCKKGLKILHKIHFYLHFFFGPQIIFRQSEILNYYIGLIVSKKKFLSSLK